ncbi:uncharacterized protein [Drosophila pseudoobscura]|uniref:Uncharacterized protein isoform X2 n=1 Tax=Drosophila pseudoobscura pseudoobscura TaxID=46245 RepID=A0A6I8VTP4_DROPS|nr:uncharacterized protein LOC26533633 isoform X2 [Drosophila pseudoobscura]
MWKMNLYSVLCAFCLLFVMIHRRHAILAVPIHSVQGPRSSNESSLQEPHVDSEHPKIVESIINPRQAQALGSGSNMGLSTGLGSKFSSKVRKNSPMMISEQREASGKQRRLRAIEDLFARTTTRPKELTIPLARGIVDSMGRRKSNYWTVTYGDVWRDTRLVDSYLSRAPRIHLVSNPLVNYYPDDKRLATVCKDKSTLISENSRFEGMGVRHVRLLLPRAKERTCRIFEKRDHSPRTFEMHHTCLSQDVRHDSRVPSPELVIPHESGYNSLLQMNNVCILVIHHKTNIFLNSSSPSNRRAGRPICKAVEMNTSVDAAAKEAHRRGKYTVVKWNLKDAMCEIHRILKAEWEREYAEFASIKHRGYCSLFPSTSSKPWFLNKTKLKAIDAKRINRLLSGNAFDRHTLAKMHVVPSNICDTCDSIDNASHLIFNCTKYNH